MDEDTRRIHRLLSDGHLSGPESEEILARVLAEARRQKKPRQVRAIGYWAGAALAAAAAVLLIVYVPRDPTGDDPFRGARDIATVEVTCSGGTLDACPSSAKLVFSVSDERASGFLSAYAEPQGEGAERTFYFSKEDGSVQLPRASATRGLAGQKAGRYRVYAVIADRALTREELIAVAKGRRIAGVRAKGRSEVVVGE